jgi:hypothetical protein
MANKKHSHRYEILLKGFRPTKKGDIVIYKVRCQVCGNEAEKTEAQLAKLNIVRNPAIEAAEEIASKAEHWVGAFPEMTPPSIKENKTPNQLCRALLLQRNFTDEQIINMVVAAFPGRKFSKGYVCTTRNDLNKGYYKKVELESPIAQIAPEGQTVCGICGRLLTDPVSVAREIGPECYQKAIDEGIIEPEEEPTEEELEEMTEA